MSFFLLFLHFSSFFFFNFVFRLFFLGIFHFDHFLVQFSKKEEVFFSRSFSFIFFAFHSIFVTFCFPLFQHFLLNLIPFSVSPFSFGFFFLKIFLFSLSLLTCFFLHSPSSFSIVFPLLFFSFFPFIPCFLLSLVFRVFFYLHFSKKIRFILCPCRDAEAFFPPLKKLTGVTQGAL